MNEDSPLHLVLGDEELLVERAVADVLRLARQRAGSTNDADVPVSRMRAGDVSTYELAELLSPSLFGDERIVVLEAAGDAGKEAAAVIASAAADVRWARHWWSCIRAAAGQGAGRRVAVAGRRRASLCANQQGQ